MNYREIIKNFFKHNYKEYTLDKIISKLSVSADDVKEFMESFYELQCEGWIYQSSKGVYMNMQKLLVKHYAGKVQVSQQNSYYVTLPNRVKVHFTAEEIEKNKIIEGDYVYLYIDETVNLGHPKNKMGHIRHKICKPKIELLGDFEWETTIKKNYRYNYYYVEKDNVVIRLDDESSKIALSGDEIIARAYLHNGEFVAEIKKLLNTREKRVFYLEKGIWHSLENNTIEIPNTFKGYKEGDRILAKYIYNEAEDTYRLEPFQLIKETNIDYDIECLALERGFSSVFPDRVMAEAEKIYREDKPDFSTRIDLTGLLTYTIDPVYAKDLDDAISIEPLGNNHYRLYVHIADVAAYVKYNSELFKEAMRRGNSCYLSHFVFPMYPGILSNNLCSLNEDGVKLTKTIEMEIDESGEILTKRTYNSYIKSDKQMNYDQVNEFFEKGIIYTDYMPFYSSLIELKNLCIILQKRRERMGKLEFDSKEFVFEYDASGNAVNVEHKMIGIANKMVENCMLVANMSWAEIAKFQNLPVMYRNLNAPSFQKSRAFQDKIREYLKYVEKSNLSTPRNYQQFMLSLQKYFNEEELDFINELAVRYQERAYYDARCIGHFALASDTYGHWTSPIRRGADTFNQIVLEEYFKRGKRTSNMYRYREFASNLGENLSEREQLADEAEKIGEYYMLKNYATNFIGQMLEATITFISSEKIYFNTSNEIPVVMDISHRGKYDSQKRCVTIGQTTYYVGNKVNIVIKNEERPDLEIPCEMVVEKELTRKRVKKND